MKRICIILFILLSFFSWTLFVVTFPLEYYPKISEMSKKYNIKKDVIYSVIKIESNFRPQICSHKGAVGLMQVVPSTGRWISKKSNLPFSEEMLLDPNYNIEIGTIYLNYLLNRYDGHMEKVLVAYNAGPSRLADGTWVNFKETTNYIKKYKIVNFFYKIRIFIREIFE